MVKRSLFSAPGGGVILLLSLPALATGQTEPAAPALSLTVKPIRDMGGLPPASANAKPLHEQLTTGFITYLKQNTSFEVADGRTAKPEKPTGEKKHWTAEGELSAILKDSTGRDSYLMTLRLYEEGKPRLLIGQWSGAARSLIAVTGNLKHDKRYSDYGLIGELGNRVKTVLLSGQKPNPLELKKRLDASLAKLKPTPDLQASLIAGVGGNEERAGDEGTLIPGQSYKVQIKAANKGDLYALSTSENGGLQSLALSEKGSVLPVEAKFASTVPTKTSWKTPGTMKEGTFDLYILQHAPGKPVSKTASESVMTILPDSLTGERANFGAEEGEEIAPPEVEVINGGARSLSGSSTAGDPALEQLIGQLEKDGGKTWRLARVRVKVSSGQPKKITPKPTPQVLIVGVGKEKDTDDATEQMKAFWTEQKATVTVLKDKPTKAEAIAAWKATLAKAGDSAPAVLAWSGKSDGTRGLNVGDTVETDENSRLTLSNLLEVIATSSAKSVLLSLDATLLPDKPLLNQMLDVAPDGIKHNVTVIARPANTSPFSGTLLGELRAASKAGKPFSIKDLTGRMDTFHGDKPTDHIAYSLSYGEDFPLLKPVE